MNYKKANVLPRLNKHESDYPSEQSPPKDLINATIVRMGQLDMEYIEGGLCIDYIPESNDIVKRLVLGYNELGIWVQYNENL